MEPVRTGPIDIYITWFKKLSSPELIKAKTTNTAALCSRKWVALK